MKKTATACLIILMLPAVGLAQIQTHSFRDGRDVVEGESAFNGRGASSTDPSSAGSAEVIMYSTSWCGVCARARQYFHAQGIPFREYDVEKSARGLAEYQQLGGKGVPLILVGDYLMEGFSEQRFMRLYDP